MTLQRCGEEDCHPDVLELLCSIGELHLTPLHGILQLRPSFTYLDKADAKHREREAANEGKRLMSFIFSGAVRFRFSLQF